MASNKRPANEGDYKLPNYLLYITNLTKNNHPLKPKLNHPLILCSLTLTLTLAMDTGEASKTKRNARLNITKQYDARVAATSEKVDPLRAKAKAALKDVDNFEVEPLNGQWGADTVPKAPAAMNPEDAPLVTLRQLMPGSTGEQDEDQELDRAFRADRIDFILVQRPLTDTEVQVRAK